MKRVMVVDDAAFMRASLKMLLERNGYEVVAEAENGEAAVKKYQQLMPDIVTMDITMPKMDGIKSIQAIRAINENANIVVISALGKEELVREAIVLGAKGFILKPIKEEHLINTLSKIK
ncbi:MAG: response regulator [Eubacteriales bacterium]|jgi:two-component system chemotaxis response regulator CheY|nr:response regulator [Eubacteriales bacterium]